MKKQLSNGIYTAEINSEGAELLSFQKTGEQYEVIWNGDKKYWAGHAPLLFPIVCAVRNGEYRHEGIVYQIGNHGFARKSEFELIEESDDHAVYKLSWNEETFKVYPFKFNLFVIYTLWDKKLDIEYRVENTDEKTIYFQLGTHPGFNCPLDAATAFEDYYLEFEKEEALDRLYLNAANVIISGKSSRLELAEGRFLALTPELFSEGAIVAKNHQSRKISLKSSKTNKGIVLTYENLPHIGIWQVKGAPYICIEPWHGFADTDDFTGEIKEKELAVSLDKGAVWSCRLSIEICS